MTKVIVYKKTIEFGDCDPAKIVWYPNYLKWVDAASRHFFVQCGVPSWRETERSMGILGTPVVDTHARFIKTASYGDELEIHVSISDWRQKSFVMDYKIFRGDDLGLVEQH